MITEESPRTWKRICRNYSFWRIQRRDVGKKRKNLNKGFMIRDTISNCPIYAISVSEGEMREWKKNWKSYGQISPKFGGNKVIPEAWQTTKMINTKQTISRQILAKLLNRRKFWKTAVGKITWHIEKKHNTNVGCFFFFLSETIEAGQNNISKWKKKILLT